MKGCSITFTIPGADALKLKEMIRERATEKGLSMSEWIVEQIAEGLRREKNKEKETQ